jgi:hypothetical protein
MAPEGLFGGSIKTVDPGSRFDRFQKTFGGIRGSTQDDVARFLLSLRRRFDLGD